nr:hypothetical protein [Planctomycetota bacterium]
MRLALLMIASCLAAAEPEAGTRVVAITGTLPLRESAFPFLPSQVCLHDATLGLRRALAAAERRVVLDLSGGFTPGLAAAEELAAVLRSRPAGVHVACLLDRVEDAALVV